MDRGTFEQSFAEAGSLQVGTGQAITLPWPEERFTSQSTISPDNDEDRDWSPMVNAVVESLESSLDLTHYQMVESNLPRGSILEVNENNDGSLVVQILNRNVDRPLDPPNASTQISAWIRLAPPGDDSAASYTVSFMRLGHDSESLPYEIAEGKIHLELPTFSDYAFVRIHLEP